MPSLVDEETLTISPASNGPLLLEGPENFQMPQNSEITLGGITDSRGTIEDPFGIPMNQDPPGSSKGSILLFGKIAFFYDVLFGSFFLKRDEFQKDLN